MRAAFEDATDARLVRVERQHLDHAAERVRAIEIAGGAANDLDAVNGRERNTIPVDPAAERIVEGPAVGDDEGAAGPGAGDSTQRHALGRRIRDARRRASKQAEAGRVTQRVVDGTGGRCEKFCGRHDRRAGRRVDAHGAARCGDRHRFGQRTRIQDDPQCGVSGVERHHRLRKAVRTHAHNRALVRRFLEREPSVGPGVEGPRRFTTILNGHRSANDRRS